jgi:hypothetical protein
MWWEFSRVRAQRHSLFPKNIPTCCRGPIENIASMFGMWLLRVQLDIQMLWLLNRVWITEVGRRRGTPGRVFADRQTNSQYWAGLRFARAVQNRKTATSIRQVTP